MHPVVRGVVWNDLDDGKRRVVFGRLEEHFSGAPAESEKAGSHDQALRVIELMRAQIGLERYADAAELYFDRLYGGRGFDFLNSGMGHVNIALLEALFPKGLNNSPMVGTERIGGVIAHLGLAYDAAGRLANAHGFALRRFKMGNLILMRQMYRGHISKRALALGRLREAVDYATMETADSDLENKGSLWLAVCEAITGRYSDAMARLATRADHGIPDLRLFRVQTQVLSGAYRDAAANGREVIGHMSSHWIQVRLSLMAYVGEAELFFSDVNSVIPLLIDTLREARAKSLVEPELQSLRCLAEAYRLRGDRGRAHSFLNDLAEPAARGPYRLIMADAANTRALLIDDPVARRAAAEEAYRLAWCDGPPFIYHRALELARRTLQELGAPPPKPVQHQ
jgi:hypothetical protein